MTADFTLQIALDIDEIARVVDAVTEFCAERGVPDRDVSRFCLALDELLSNVIFYGLEDQTGQHITTRLSYEGGCLEAEITDHGKPFDPFHDAPAPDLDSPIEDRRVGGVGVHLVRKLMDETAYWRDGTTNHTLIRKIVQTAREG